MILKDEVISRNVVDLASDKLYFDIPTHQDATSTSITTHQNLFFVKGSFVDRRTVPSTSTPATRRGLDIDESGEAISSESRRVPCKATAQEVPRRDRPFRALGFVGRSPPNGALEVLLCFWH